MSSFFGASIQGKRRREDVDHLVRLVDRQGRLRDVGELALIGELEPLGLLGRLHEDDRLLGLAHRPLDLLVALRGRSG